MNSAQAHILEVLDLQTQGDDLYRGINDNFGTPNVYGGQILGQACAAANLSVTDEQQMHSMHGYFLAPGNRQLPMDYHVSTVREGRSFCTRRVSNWQGESNNFSCIVSYQRQEENVHSQGAEMPVGTPMPDEVPTTDEQKDAVRALFPTRMLQLKDHPYRAFDFRFVDPPDYRQPEGYAPNQRIWLKANSRLSDAPKLHSALFAYLGDFILLPTSLRPHGIGLGEKRLKIASLDHAIWCHRPFRVDEWMLFNIENRISAHGRAFCRAEVFNCDGALLATVVQEGLLRLREDTD